MCVYIVSSHNYVYSIKEKFGVGLGRGKGDYNNLIFPLEKIIFLKKILIINIRRKKFGMRLGRGRGSVHYKNLSFPRQKQKKQGGTGSREGS